MRFPLRVGFIAGAVALFSVGVVAAQFLPQGFQFRDVPQTAFYSEAAVSMAQRGIITGYDDGRFGGNDYVTRGQVAVIVQRYDKTMVQPLREQIRQLQQQLNVPYCGDGAKSSTEQCDDGNNLSGDGCTAECLSEIACAGGYYLGQSFPAQDNCNTCTCTAGGIVCTQRSCVQKKCFSSAECSTAEYCSTEVGDCQYPCPAGAVCIQACAGVCLPRAGASSSRSVPPVPQQICGNGICDEGEIGFIDRTGSLTYCPEDCPLPTSVCGNGICEDGESDEYSFSCDPTDPVCNPTLLNRGTCVSDCEGGISSCERLEQHVNTLFQENRSCQTDSDCDVFVRGCSPYQTCGKPVRKDALETLTFEMESLVTECPQNGTPQFCATCLATQVVCQAGQCVLQE